MTSEVLVDLKDVYFKHDTDWILRQFNLSVNKGTIFSLLGPSGAGKTTIIGLILRELVPQFGEVTLNGVLRRKDYGYMPQKTSLFGDLTIKETCEYYSNVFGIGGIPDHTTELLRMLEVRNCEAQVCSLSEGSKRKVSFAIALIHQPQFLLLDEPTASLDCLHSKNVWNYLISLSKNGATIILTTHYVQEAINSTTVGFLRNGQLIAHNTPQALNELYGTTDFDLMFAMLASAQDELSTQDTTLPCKKFTGHPSFLDDGFFKWHSFRAQAIKNKNWFKRNFSLVFLHCLMFPSLLAVLFCLGFGGDPIGLKVAAISESAKQSNSVRSASFNELLSCSLPDNYEYFMYKRLKKEAEIIDYNNVEEAIADLKQGKIDGIIKFDNNFTSSLTNFYADISSFKNENVDSAIIKSYLDTSDYMSSFFLKNLLAQSALGVFEDIEIYCNTSKTRVYSSPIKFENPIYGWDDIPFVQRAYPAVISIVAIGFTLIFSVQATVSERKEGSFKRNLITGLTYIEMVSAHCVFQIILMLIQDFIFLSTLLWIFGFPHKGDFLDIISVMVACNIMGISVAFLCVELSQNDILAMIGATFFMGTHCILGGFLWPQICFPKWLQMACYVIPGTHTSGSVTAVAVKGLPHSNPEVYTLYIQCTIWLAVGVLGCNYFFKLNKNNIS